MFINMLEVMELGIHLFEKTAMCSKKVSVFVFMSLVFLTVCFIYLHLNKTVPSVKADLRSKQRASEDYSLANTVQSFLNRTTLVNRVTIEGGNNVRPSADNNKAVPVTLNSDDLSRSNMDTEQHLQDIDHTKLTDKLDTLMSRTIVSTNKTSGKLVSLEFMRQLGIMQSFQSPPEPLIFGTQRTHIGYLTFGIPTVRRPNTDHIYLFDTLDSLINKIPDTDYNLITIVIMTSDYNSTYRREIAEQIYKRYRSHCDKGLIQVIESPVSLYPDLNKVKPSYNDSKPRRIWRAKQNLDYGFLMLYSRNISDFYIQLEDDVIAATDYVEDIRSIVNTNQQRWFLLELSRLGFIGKFFHSSDLEYAGKFLIDNYQEAPCDILLGSMRVGKGQLKPIHVNHSLFQHIGKFSSLKDKLNPLVDGSFKDAAKLSIHLDVPKGDNPPAEIKTSLEAYLNFTPSMSYDNDSTTFFWAKSHIEGDHFTLMFETPYNFSRIIVSTGNQNTKGDSFYYGDVLYSVAGRQDNQAAKCGCKFRKLTSLVEGDIDTSATAINIPYNIKCLRLYVTQELGNWIIIRDFQLFLHNV